MDAATNHTVTEPFNFTTAISSLGSLGVTSTMSTVAMPQYHLVWTSAVVFRVTTIIVVMVFTIIGNTSLIAGIVCHRNLRRKRVNIFLMNLAVGDLMVCFVTMTTEILFVAFGEWVLGAAACKIVIYGQIVTLGSATFLLTAMSIDRYQVIVQPFKSLTGQPKIWRKVLTAWILALLFAIPHLFIWVQIEDGVHPDGRIRYMCRSRGYTEEWQRKLSFTLMTVYVLIIPTIIMSYCYINIIRVVWMRTASHQCPPPKLRFVSRFKRSRAASNTGDTSPVMTPHRPSQSGSDCGNNLNIPPRLVSSSKRNVIKMTLSVIIGFVVCWTPYFVIGLIRIFTDYTYRMQEAYSVAEILALVHSALNPILYGIFSTHMARRACKHLCMTCLRRESVAVRELNISEDDSSYWTDTKIHNLSMTRFSIAQPLARNQNTGRDNLTTLDTICQGFRSLFHCKIKEPTNKPLLIYRRAMCNGSTHVPHTEPQYETFRMRTQSTCSHINRNSSCFSHPSSIHSDRQARSSAHLPSASATTTTLSLKSVSESNINRVVNPEITFSPLSQTPRWHEESSTLQIAQIARPESFNDSLQENNNENHFSLDSVVKNEVDEYLATL